MFQNRIFIRSRCLLKKTKRWPHSGFSPKCVSTKPDSASKLLRISTGVLHKYIFVDGKTFSIFAPPPALGESGSTASSPFQKSPLACNRLEFGLLNRWALSVRLSSLESPSFEGFPPGSEPRMVHHWILLRLRHFPIVVIGLPEAHTNCSASSIFHGIASSSGRHSKIYLARLTSPYYQLAAPSVKRRLNDSLLLAKRTHTQAAFLPQPQLNFPKFLLAHITWPAIVRVRRLAPLLLHLHHRLVTMQLCSARRDFYATRRTDTMMLHTEFCSHGNKSPRTVVQGERAACLLNDLRGYSPD